MKTTPEQLAELKALAIADRRETFTAYTVLALLADLEEAGRLSVENILLDVVPGDGSGLEVFAQSVADVEAKLTALSEKAEETDSLRAELAATRQQLSEVPAQIDAARQQGRQDADPITSWHLQMATDAGRDEAKEDIYNLRRLVDDREQKLSEANQIKETVIAERADWMHAAYDLLEAIGEPLPLGALPRDVADRGVVQAKSLRQQLAEAQSALLAARNSKEHYQEQWSEVCNENQTLRNQLAKAQAKNAELVQYFFSAESEIGSHLPTCALKAIALAKQVSDTTALSAVITKAVEPYKRDAERYRYGKSKEYSFARTSGLIGDDYIFWLCEEDIDAALAAKEFT